jgi:ribosomal protein S12 methylthiotransferase
MIPMIRGDLVSVPPLRVIREAEELVLSGAKEICLVGQDLTSYGRDIGPGGCSLENLMEMIEDRFKGQDVWFRLLYLHPLRVGKRLIERVAGSELFLNYLDIPVQHSDPDILKAMNREGTEGEKVLDLFSFARSLDPDFALRTTLMVGFPGETEDHFLSLASFLENSEIDRAGVFTFFPEEGTPAEKFEGQVPKEVKEERLERLISLQESISLRRQKSFEGKVLKVLVEEVKMQEGYL